MDASFGFRIGTVGGIPIRVHFAFLLVLPFLAYGFAGQLAAAARLAGIPEGSLGGSPWIWGLALALALFASVLLHELAHSAYAIRKGGRVRAITLLPIGGVAEIEEPPPKPGQEAVMALVGPATSLLLGAVLLAANRATLGLRNFELSFGLYYLGYLNLSLGLFNLLPAFPMDGGRILRGLLARKKGPLRATRIAAGVGKLFAVAFALLGFLSSNLLLVVVGVFVFLGAVAEERGVVLRAVLGDLRVREVMTPQSEAIPAGETLYDAGERMIRERRLAFPVTDDGRVLGVLSVERVERVPLERRREVRAREAAESAPAVDPDDRVSEALRILDERRLAQLPITHEGHLVGTLSRSEIARDLLLRELQASQRRAVG
jgi:Zn-dependent protease